MHGASAAAVGAGGHRRSRRLGCPILAALPEIDALIEALGNGGLITLEKAEIIEYTHGRPA
jgi:hypothetical protein